MLRTVRWVSCLWLSRTGRRGQRDQTEVMTWLWRVCHSCLSHWTGKRRETVREGERRNNYGRRQKRRMKRRRRKGFEDALLLALMMEKKAMSQGLQTSF